MKHLLKGLYRHYALDKIFSESKYNEERRTIGLMGGSQFVIDITWVSFRIVGYVLDHRVRRVLLYKIDGSSLNESEDVKYEKLIFYSMRYLYHDHSA